MRRLWLAACVMGAMFVGVPVASATDWVIQRPPLPAGVYGALEGVSCTSASACTAVGAMATSQGTLTLAERWDGTQWTLQSTPNRPGLNNGLASVSCASATECVAVGSSGIGSSDSGSTTIMPLVERWNGTSWSIQPVPAPGGVTRSLLLSVSCPSTSFCVASGDLYDPFVHPLSGPAFIDMWDGTRWSQSTLVGAKNLAELPSVSCSTPTACAAVGTFLTNEQRTADLVEQWNGTVWSTHTIPLPAGVSTLLGVSCPDPTACNAVGTEFSFPSGGGLNQPFDGTWDGTSWSGHHVPDPGGTLTMLSGVSCPSATGCTAVGRYLYFVPSGEGLAALAEFWDGTRWSIEPTPFTGATSTVLTGVSCWSSQGCMAIGTDSGQSVPLPLLSEYRNG
jgi:hypothetical protein